MKKIRLNFQSLSCSQQALLLQKETLPETPKRLLLVHGAGIGGELTWSFVAHYLDAWDEILIPDLAGMGHSAFLNNKIPSLDDYLQQLNELVAQVGWPDFQFDLAGYSFGGMLVERWLRKTSFNGLCFLIEPAMLFSADAQQILDKSKNYAAAAKGILQDPLNEAAYVQFLDNVSPKRDRSDKSEQIIIKRLQQNPIGFAHSLLAITESLNNDSEYFTQWVSPWSGASFVGGLSWPAMHQRHKRLAEESSHWHYETVANADHSLVFTRPRTVALVMNKLKKNIDF